MKFLRFYWYIAVAFIYLFIILSLYRSYHRVNLKKWSQMVILLIYLSRTKILFEEAIFFLFLMNKKQKFSYYGDSKDLRWWWIHFWRLWGSDFKLQNICFSRDTALEQLRGTRTKIIADSCGHAAIAMDLVLY